MSLRVLLLDHTAAVGGGELALLRLLDALDDDVQPHLTLFADGPLAERARALGVPVTVLALDPGIATMDRHRAGGLGALRRVPGTVAFGLRLARHVRRVRPDVVHANSLKAYLVGLCAAGAARVPLVWWVHDRVTPDYLPGVLVRLLRGTARRLPAVVVANSRATAATVPGARGLVVAYPGFAPEQARPFPVDGPPDGPPQVLLLGRISPTKGQLELVRAAALLQDRWPDVRFRLVGDPLFGAEDHAREVDAEIDRLGLGGVVVRHPAVVDPAAEIDRATVVVHASPAPEPFGQVVVEAMVRGVPVIATDAGGVPEILAPDGEEPLGLLVPPGDVDALARALDEVLADPAAARRRARRAHTVAVERFAVARTAATTVTAWRSAAGRRSSRNPAARASSR
ncbi:glycosyltransferase involved in cell wall biosynthesis [Isoptericola jiangsuensis]|uniref:Glycosyltransferase involved in cell wall biosynthesis n=1 Tax=Isoptericola jiangsuensis TaxID=548579 RepID=A0A2A9F154_9MICO|nr:glycosyltransferase family 4 protein [Isoptericola jiangsuensis]PFG44230.1 glycosyltransferase involved in cell wall biosynthesis [Isoptericola jiangsuensis]